MARSRNADPRAVRGRRRHRRGRGGKLEPLAPESLDDQEILDELERAPLVPESGRRPDELAPYSSPAELSADDYDRVREIAERKANLYIDGGKKAIVVLVLLIIPPLTWLGVILGVVWGIRFGRRYFGLMVEPGLRERLVVEEVEKQVQVNESRERPTMEGQHSRSLEQLSASIAHEIRNPITAAKSLVQQMSEEPDSTDNAEYARVAVEELERVERSISHLLRFARDEDMRISEIKMIDVIESALETFRDRAARDGVEIVRHFDCDGVLMGDADKLRRIVINLVGNAIDALVDARVEQPAIEMSLGENLAGTEVWVRVKDNGVGIDESMRQKIFSPFVTSKSGGTGLGLPITKKLIEAHGGTIELISEPGRGAEFVLAFPKHSAEEGGRQ